MTPIVLSVRHTGTRFTRRLLGDCEYVHVDELDDETQLSGYLIVIPLRDPRGVYRSWFRRSAQKKARQLEHFRADWERLSAVSRDACLLPVDSASRDGYLASLAAQIGRELKTDWKPHTERGPRAEMIWERRRLEAGLPVDPPPFDFAPILSLPVLRGIYS